MSKEKWIPKTEIGKKVMEGEIKTLEQLHQRNKPILEYQITDKLLGNINEEVLNINQVIRVTDSGRRRSFTSTAAIGDKNGHIGVGEGKGKEVPKAIDKAIKKAKKNVKAVERGCGSWECDCGEEHSIPLEVTGKSGSVKVTIKPAPKGTGIVAGETASKILKLTGIKDAWTKTEGSTNTKNNFAKATLNALTNTMKVKK